jgi:hypothetical protein
MATTPEQTVLGDVYRYVWAEEGISIVVERIHSDSRDNLTGEIIVETTNPGTPAHLHQARLNLGSTQARKTIAKHLEERLPEVDWAGIIEQACTMTLRSYREGEPTVLIGNLPPREQSKFLLYPIIYKDMAAVIFGPGGIGKSYLSTLIAICLQTGTSIAGLEPNEVVNVLYLDYETSKEDLNERIQSLKVGMDLPDKAEFHYRYCYQPLASEISELRHIVATEKIGFIVIDSKGSACGGESESAEAVLRYFAALRSLEITSLTIDHVAKSDADRPFGSVYTTNQARVMYQLRGNQEPGEEKMEVGLFQRKNNMGKLMKPIGLRFDFLEGATEVTETNIVDMPVIAEGLPLHERIRDELKTGPVEGKDLAELFQVSEGSVRATMARHKHLFERLPDGRWGLKVVGGVT